MPRKVHSFSATLLDGPALDRARFNLSNADLDEYPFSIPLIQQLDEIVFPTQVTFFVGENGSGKSTLLESIAWKAGMNIEGGSKNMRFLTTLSALGSAKELAERLTLSWRMKPSDAYFFRAESFHNVANYLDQLEYEDFHSYGGQSLHTLSHGESFWAFFSNRMGYGGFFVLDEPEAALSPQNQLAFLRVIHDLCQNRRTQFLIATHSPILLAYPGATIYSLDAGAVERTIYEDTEHFKLTKSFLNDPATYFHHLFEEQSESSES